MLSKHSTTAAFPALVPQQCPGQPHPEGSIYLPPFPFSLGPQFTPSQSKPDLDLYLSLS
jgi:hypothetical protein